MGEQPFTPARRGAKRAFIIAWLAWLIASPGSVIATMAAQKENRMSDDFLSAVAKGDVARVTEMLKADAALVRATDKNGTSAILLATYHNKPEVAAALLATGVELNIFEAAATGRTDRVRALLDKDAAQVNAYAADGFYPLGLAVFFGHPETARLLVERGADVNQAARNAMNVRPLHAAAAARQLELSKLLIERGADVNAPQQAGLRPLHEAAATGQAELARLLLAHGAAINIKSDAGKTALVYAVENGQAEMAKLLESAGATR
jgi:ankyrin repeat protein